MSGVASVPGSSTPVVSGRSQEAPSTEELNKIRERSLVKQGGNYSEEDRRLLVENLTKAGVLTADKAGNDDKLFEAILEYQKKNQLLKDGIVGDQTWAHLLFGKTLPPGAKYVRRNVEQGTAARSDQYSTASGTPSAGAGTSAGNPVATSTAAASDAGAGAGTVGSAAGNTGAAPASGAAGAAGGAPVAPPSDNSSGSPSNEQVDGNNNSGANGAQTQNSASSASTPSSGGQWTPGSYSIAAGAGVGAMLGALLNPRARAASTPIPIPTGSIPGGPSAPTPAPARLALPPKRITDPTRLLGPATQSSQALVPAVPTTMATTPPANAAVTQPVAATPPAAPPAAATPGKFAPVGNLARNIGSRIKGIGSGMLNFTETRKGGAVTGAVAGAAVVAALDPNASPTQRVTAAASVATFGMGVFPKVRAVARITSLITGGWSISLRNKQ